MKEGQSSCKDFLGSGTETNCARINKFLPGPGEPHIQKTRLAELADLPSAAHVSHLESFVRGDRECQPGSWKEGLIEKKKVGRYVYFRLTPEGAAMKARHTAQYERLRDGRLT